MSDNNNNNNNNGGDPYKILQSYRFVVNANGGALGFKTVKGLKVTASFEPLNVGGVNDGPVMLRLPVRTSDKLTLERGKYFSSLKSVPKLFPGQLLSDMCVVILDDSGKPQARYNVNKAVVESIELSDLDAEKSGILIEKITVVHFGITESKD